MQDGTDTITGRMQSDGIDQAADDQVANDQQIHAHRRRPNHRAEVVPWARLGREISADLPIGTAHQHPDGFGPMAIITSAPCAEGKRHGNLTGDPGSHLRTNTQVVGSALAKRAW